MVLLCHVQFCCSPPAPKWQREFSVANGFLYISEPDAPMQEFNVRHHQTLCISHTFPAFPKALLCNAYTYLKCAQALGDCMHLATLVTIPLHHITLHHTLKAIEACQIETLSQHINQCVYIIQSSF